MGGAYKKIGGAKVEFEKYNWNLQDFMSQTDIQSVRGI